MDEDQVAGAAQRMAGKVEAAAGNLSGDAKWRVEGRGRQTFGEAQQALGNLKDTAGQTLGLVQEQVRESPFAALLIAGIVGWVIGRLSD